MQYLYSWFRFREEGWLTGESRLDLPFLQCGVARTAKNPPRVTRPVCPNPFSEEDREIQSVLMEVRLGGVASLRESDHVNGSHLKSRNAINLSVGIQADIRNTCLPNSYPI